jgi:Holliday junction resolvase RusA-like endonuclease
MTITLPFPISIWKAYGRRGAARCQYLTSEYKAFQQSAQWALKQQSALLPEGKTFRFSVALVANDWITKKGEIRKRDAENYLKTLIDTLTMWFNAQGQDFDDSQITELTVKKVQGQVKMAVVLIEAVQFQ